MHIKNYDVYGIGNALVDTEYLVEDSFLVAHGIAKGRMTLVEPAFMQNILTSLHEDYELAPSRKSGGGSAANTIIAAQSFGSKSFYSCKLAEDETGTFFYSDLDSTGVSSLSHTKRERGVSGQCVVLITPDAQRSMNTNLGISESLSIKEIDEEILRQSRFLYIEGYLCTSPSGRAAAIRCREVAEQHHVETSLTLSDTSMVEFFRTELEQMLGNGVDHLFGNEEEALSWAKTDRLDIAITELKDVAKTLNITLGAKGSMVIEPHRQKLIPGYAVKPKDTTGAGDIYAGACLHGWASGMGTEESATLANYSAAQLITRFGARFDSVKEYLQLKRSLPRN
ncbi:MAG: adenosine kinase [Pseudomonadales bacterium]|nr:adenosine kinase [Pseudomonadales bacterium]